MKNKLLYRLRSGKNSKFIYYGINLLRLLIPNVFYQMRLNRMLSSFERRTDKSYIEERVNYYNKLSSITDLSSDAPILATHKLPKKGKVYFFDTYEYTRFFPSSLKWEHCPGDIIYVPSTPSIVKSRPLTENNENSIIMKLDKVRHFIFVKDKLPFHAKKDKVIFRGKVKGKASRREFMEMYFHHPMCDLGDVSKHTDDPQVMANRKENDSGTSGI